MKQLILMVACLVAVIGQAGCKRASQPVVDLPESSFDAKAIFDADSAYLLVKAQTDLGPRTPGSKSHEQCEQLIIDRLKAYGADSIISQRSQLKAFNEEMLPMHNILGQFNLKAKKRILLLAHYDTRPWADAEADTSLHDQPIPGANDGGSGVAVLLEVARHINSLNPKIGVDLLFTDLEDYGQSEGFDSYDSSWALGAQYWAKHMPYHRDSLPVYGIGVDMVGGHGATFRRGYYSEHYAPDVLSKVWNMAERSGFQDRFLNNKGGGIIDDFLFINRGGIPSINIIESNNQETRSFPATWHTLKDDIGHIDPQSLRAVGQTLINLITVEKL